MTKAKFERPRDRIEQLSQYGCAAQGWLRHAGMSAGLYIAYWTLAAWQRRGQ